MIVKDVIELSVKDAVAIRFKELCDQRGIRPNELAVRSGVTPSTVYSMLDSSRHSVSIGTIKNSATALTFLLESFSPALCLMILSRKFNRSTYTPLIRFRQQPDRI